MLWSATRVHIKSLATYLYIFINGVTYVSNKQLPVLYADDIIVFDTNNDSKELIYIEMLNFVRSWFGLALTNLPVPLIAPILAYLETNLKTYK